MANPKSGPDYLVFITKEYMYVYASQFYIPRKLFSLTPEDVFAYVFPVEDHWSEWWVVKNQEGR
jgi:hypothetical protein